MVDDPANAGNCVVGFLFVSKIWVWLRVTFPHKINLGNKIFFFMDTFFDFFRGAVIFTRALSDFFTRTEKNFSSEN